MSKFGLLGDEEADATAEPESLSNKLAAFSAVRPRTPIDLQAVDAAAAPHGFVSREASATPSVSMAQGRRRRAVPAEPVRHLAIRLGASQYDRFVAYADRYQLTYHDSIKKLLDSVGE